MFTTTEVATKRTTCITEYNTLLNSRSKGSCSHHFAYEKNYSVRKACADKTLISETGETDCTNDIKCFWAASSYVHTNRFESCDDPLFVLETYRGKYTASQCDHLCSLKGIECKYF